MTTILCQYDGALRCSAVHVPSGSQLATDAPSDNQGLGERFSPTDLVATALATCILTIMGIVAERQGLALKGCTARVEKTMTTAGIRRIERLTVWVALPAGLTQDQIQVLRRAAEGCPVKRSLEGAVAMELRWETL
jgi:putative redox protein